MPPQQRREQPWGAGGGGAAFTVSSSPSTFCLWKTAAPEDAVFRKAVGVRRVTFQILQRVDGMEPSREQL